MKAFKGFKLDQPDPGDTVELTKLAELLKKECVPEAYHFATRKLNYSRPEFDPGRRVLSKHAQP